MNNPITAIYENGIFRPITPLDLPDQVQVQIVIQPFDEPKVASSSDRPKPTMAKLLAELREINKLEPEEIELPARKDRPNPLLEMPNEFFV
jgi:predicted DNA-binding antitoxin AbrB/MazE fold protein